MHESTTAATSPNHHHHHHHHTTSKHYSYYYNKTRLHMNMHNTQEWKVMVWHMFTYVMTLPGCDSCATLEGRYVLNHSSLININESGL